MSVFSANDFKSVTDRLLQEKQQNRDCSTTSILTNPLSGEKPNVAICQPMKSSIVDYELLLMQGKN
jgi:hypothetical protein